MVELLGIAQFLDAWYFFADHRVAARCAVEISSESCGCTRWYALGLNNDCAYPRAALLGCSSAVPTNFASRPPSGPFALNGDTEQALAQEHDQHLKLIVAQIFISKLLPIPLYADPDSCGNRNARRMSTLLSCTTISADPVTPVPHQPFQ